MKIKVGDLVSVRVHIANTHNGGKMLLSEPEAGIVTSRLNGDGYYDVLINRTGKIIFTSYANLEVINESR
ncbi:hypothetical protein OAA64_01735 [bacterium]|nr:hypothetical protein [bacterium]